MADKRDYDLVLFGATGFTGGLIAEYLAKNAGENIRWAIAGRDPNRLDEVKASLTNINPACAAVGILRADNRDWASMAIMANKTRLVLTTVGPYIDGGDKLVRACVAGGADYVDITGETDFVAEVIRQFDSPAREQGIRIVNCCGFDSIPHDLGVLYTVKQLPAGQPIAIEGFVQVRGQFSGGTWRSAVKMMGRMRNDRDSQVAMGQAFGSGVSDGRRVRSLRPSVRYERKVNGWAIPMPSIDPLVIRRSASMLDRYGPDFAYGHYLALDSLARVAQVVAGVGTVAALAQLRPTREWLLNRRASGEGPSPEQIERGMFRVTFVGKSADHTVLTEVSGGDPGYGDTSKMAAEAALCLLCDRDQIPDRAGVLTPAVAMGDVLMKRLQRAGMRFESIEFR